MDKDNFIEKLRASATITSFEAKSFPNRDDKYFYEGKAEGLREAAKMLAAETLEYKEVYRGTCKKCGKFYECDKDHIFGYYLTCPTIPYTRCPHCGAEMDMKKVVIA